jgi:hypothetical protein
MSDIKENEEVVGFEDDDLESYNNFVTLELEDGSVLSCEILDIIEVDGHNYMALVPEGSEEYLIYGYLEKGEDFELINIDDKDEYDKVAEAFQDYIESFDEEDDFDFDIDDDDYELDEEDDEEE